MQQSPARQLEDMQATLVRVIAAFENQQIKEAHRLLFLLRGMIEGALAEAQHGAWGRGTAPMSRKPWRAARVFIWCAESMNDRW
jgi:hypothetical protein